MGSARVRLRWVAIVWMGVGCRCGVEGATVAGARWWWERRRMRD